VTRRSERERELSDSVRIEPFWEGVFDVLARRERETKGLGRLEFCCRVE
jgi:hypothetical protein